MTNQHPSLRFDHREIAVIFSLFVFVSLLMFTVGILVGKGLAQAKYESTRMIDSSHAEPPTVSLQPSKHSGTSITTNQEKSAGPIGAEPAQNAHHEAEAKPSRSTIDDEPIQTSSRLKLVPQRGKENGETGDSLLEPGSKGVSENILKNPQIASLLEEESPAQKGKRSVASASVPTKIPGSYANGKYTVQVGSYPTEKDATDRVDSLKKLGFPYAHFSAKELGDNKETWFRVWLGFYPDYQGANDSGRILKDRGEVRHYLVRKSDTAG